MRKIIMTIMVSLAFLLHATAQDRTISGKIIDEKGVPVDGVSVLSSDSKNGTKTNNGGMFTVSISKNTKSLLFSSVGFEAQRVNIGSQNNIEVTLKATDTKLDEIVVVGYETRRKRDLSAPMSTVKGSDIAKQTCGCIHKCPSRSNVRCSDKFF